MRKCEKILFDTIKNPEDKHFICQEFLRNGFKEIKNKTKEKADGSK